MDSDKQSAKNGKGAPKRRISALQKVAGSIPAGSDVGSSLDDFIATANQTLTDTDAFKLTSDITGESKKKEEAAAAALEAAAAQNAAELARVAAEEAARKVLAEVTRKSAQQVAQLEAKLAQAEARATSVERKVRAPRAPSVPPLASLSIDEGPDFAEGSFSQSFGLVAMRRRRANALKAIGIMGAAAVIAGGVFLLGNGRLWNKPDKNSAPTAAAPAVAAEKPAVNAPAAKPTVSQPAPTPAPAVTALPDEPEVAAVRAKAAKVDEVKVEPAPVPQPAAAAPQQPTAVPLVSSLAPVKPTVTPLDGDEDDHPARKSSKKKKTASHKKASASSKSSGGKKASGGIVDPFAP